MLQRLQKQQRLQRQLRLQRQQKQQRLQRLLRLQKLQKQQTRRDPRTRTSKFVGIMARLGATRRALRLPSQAQWHDLTLLLDARSAISGAATCPLPAR